MMFKTEELCQDYLIKNDKFTYKGNGIGCNGTFDKIMCWESVPANTTIKISCPNFKGLFDTTKHLYKKCLDNGFWEGYNITNKYYGYTNYKDCLTENSLEQSNQINNIENSELIYKIVSHVELVGLILSLICICFSLSIFGYHKNLRCKRTKIHLNLFLTIFLQSVIRLLFFIDRYLFRYYNPDLAAYESQFMLLDKSICPILTALLEYIQTCNFMWMLNEGAYLNILLTYSVFDNNKKNIIICFYIIGWGLPAIIVLSWFIVLIKTIGIDDICWSGFYNWDTYWIIKGPIFAALIINVLCLVNVIRILTNILRENRTSEIEQIKKSLKAAILLLPLLGMTHIFEVYYGEPTNWILNLITSVLKAFLVFYQGVFLSILYCFMNNEVKNVIQRNWLSKIKFQSKCFETRIKNNRTRNSSKDGRDDLDTRERDNLVDVQMTELNTNTKTNLMSKTETTII